MSWRGRGGGGLEITAQQVKAGTALAKDPSLFPGTQVKKLLTSIKERYL